MQKSFLLSFIFGSFLLMGCSTESKKSGTPALFNTKAEAEKAANQFNCTGAHKMGDKWMPCKKHGSHKHHQHTH
tara:strand:- start:1771 stop:1992 length:222 start_codon:yes stop_codon:yes gene_type:complete